MQPSIEPLLRTGWAMDFSPECAKLVLERGPHGRQSCDSGKKHSLLWEAAEEELFHSRGAFLVAQAVTNLLAIQETRVRSPAREDPLEKGMATHSTILAWRTPWTEEPGGLQFTESQRVRHD